MHVQHFTCSKCNALSALSSQTKIHWLVALGRVGWHIDKGKIFCDRCYRKRVYGESEGELAAGRVKPCVSA